LQELELTGRSSLGRSEVMSGLGGEEARTDVPEILAETRDKVARLLSELENGEQQLPVQEYVLLLGDLLLHSDQVHFSLVVNPELYILYPDPTSEKFRIWIRIRIRIIYMYSKVFQIKIFCAKACLRSKVLFYLQKIICKLFKAKIVSSLV
jgi:hypothetical protein